MSNNEDAIFKEEVEQVKQWWKVCLIVATGYHGHLRLLDRNK